jgi:hypothetical protein
VDQKIVLDPLVCLKCSAPIPAEPDQVAWSCSTCGQGLYLDEASGLTPLEINFAANLTPNTPGKPFWITEGRIVVERETFGSAKSDEALRFWSQTHRFFIPAFRAPLDTLLTISTDLLLHPLELHTGPAARFEPVIMSKEDVKPAVEFVIVAVEAGRSDRLKQISFTLDLSQPVLWILP